MRPQVIHSQYLLARAGEVLSPAGHAALRLGAPVQLTVQWEADGLYTATIVVEDEEAMLLTSMYDLDRFRVAVAAEALGWSVGGEAGY